MIYRDNSGNIVITPESIPEVAGLISCAEERLRFDLDDNKCPEWMAKPFLDAAKVFQIALETNS